MKILVAAKRLAANRTSEGICSSKFVAALVAEGHDVRCVTGETLSADEQTWHAAHAPLALLGPDDAATSIASQRLAAASSLGAYAVRKMNGATARATGYSLAVWAEVNRWRHAIQAATSQWTPDAIVVRGAGREFEPHMAMLGWRAPCPWIAHYHDPYPISLYPEPYRQRIALQSPRQERVHRHILAAADGLTFPSRRLLEWVLAGDLAPARQKAFVVPHIAGGRVDAPAPPLAAGSSALTVVHAGTLLRERDPRPFLRGVRAFIDAEPLGAAQLRLVFIGRVDAMHSSSVEWRALENAGVLSSVNDRVSYAEAAAASASADALLLIEAPAPESPFFPAKLADNLDLGKPIVAVTPVASVTTDLLGTEYPLRVSPEDPQGAARVVTTLWRAWRDGDIDHLVPPAHLAGNLSEAAVGRAASRLFKFVLSPTEGRAA